MIEFNETMATQYLLPCSCGQAVRVNIHQAGETIVCQCGKTLQVPSMRKLRELKPAPPEESVGKAARHWSKREGIIFAAGLLVVFVGLGIAGYFQLGRLTLNTEESRYDNLDESLRRIDDMNVAELWDTWIGVRRLGMGPYSPPQFIVNRHVSGRWLTIIWGGLGLALIGMLICAVAVMMRKPAGHGAR